MVQIHTNAMNKLSTKTQILKLWVAMYTIISIKHGTATYMIHLHSDSVVFHASCIHNIFAIYLSYTKPDADNIIAITYMKTVISCLVMMMR